MSAYYHNDTFFLRHPDKSRQSVITWIPVSERLPGNDRVVLVALESNGPLVWFGYLEDEAWRLAAGDKIAVRVDHWAELPEPPKE